jgi:uncharacterized protein YdeI (YjbR/CyaY-like superfamily)
MQDARVDAYLAKAGPFAQPVLKHLRTLVHQACPEVEETIKWGFPFFMYRGIVLASMAAFKAHCSFGLWGPEIRAVLVKDGFAPSNSAGSFGRITRIEDLPKDKVLLGYLRQAAGFVASGERITTLTPRPKKKAKVAIQMPAEFAAALKKSRAAATVFAEFSPSCKREYVEWIAEAKRPETQARRIEQAMEWITEGKARNWKYQ